MSSTTTRSTPTRPLCLSAVPKGHSSSNSRSARFSRETFPRRSTRRPGCVFHPRCPKAREVAGRRGRGPGELPDRESRRSARSTAKHTTACWYPLRKGDELERPLTTSRFTMTFSIAAWDPDGVSSRVGRRGRFEVPRGRLRGPVGPSGGRSRCYPGAGEPLLRPRRSRRARRRRLGPGGRRSPHRA